MHVAHNSDIDQDQDEHEIFDQQTSTLPIYGTKPKKPGLYLGALGYFMAEGMRRKP